MEKTKKPLIKTIGNVIFTIFIVVSLIVIALSFIAKKTNKPILNYSMLWVMTNSMEPSIEAQSYILVKKADVSKLKEGDVITFRSNDASIKGSYNTHRIYEVVVEGQEFVTKGDHNIMPDVSHVYAEDIDYVFVSTLPVMTAFGRAFASKTGFLLIVSVIMIFIVIYSFITIKNVGKDADKNNKEKEIDRLVKEEIARLEKEQAEKTRLENGQVDDKIDDAKAETEQTDQQPTETAKKQQT